MKKFLITACVGVVMCGGVYGTAKAEVIDPARQALLAQIEQLVKLVQELQTQIAAQSAAGSTTDTVFTNPVTLGSSNNSVTLLQQVLASDPEVYPEAMITGYFGTLTSSALRNFQRAWGLEVTGTFTNQTRFVLATVLDTVPLTTDIENYLQNAEVKSTIKQAISDFSTKSTVVGGRVTFATGLSFEFGQKNSNIATLQRILATDPALYPEQQVSGEYTIATGEAVSRLQSRYGLTVTATVDVETKALLEEILRLNNAATIQSDLLHKDSVAPNILINKRSREIVSIEVVNDYREKNISAKVEYEGSLVDTFTLFPENSADKNTKSIDVVKKRLAVLLDRPLNSFESTVEFTIIEKPELPYLAVIQVAADKSLSAYLAFKIKGKVDYKAPLDIDMSYQVVFKGKTMTLTEASEEIANDAIAGKPVDPELVEVVRKEAVFFYDATAGDVSKIPVEYEVDSRLKNSLQNDNAR